MNKTVLILVALVLALTSCGGGGSTDSIPRDWKSYTERFSALIKKIPPLQNSSDLNSVKELGKIMEELSQLQKAEEEITKKLSAEESQKFTEAMAKIASDQASGK